MKAAIIVASAFAVGVFLGGCRPPERLSWDEKLPTLGPVSEGPSGSLLVETPQGNGTGDDVEKHHPFYLYGADGKLLDRFPNDYALPVRVRPGKYIVVGEGLGGYRKVHVEVKESMSTAVNLTDLERGSRVE